MGLYFCRFLLLSESDTSHNLQNCLLGLLPRVVLSTLAYMNYMETFSKITKLDYLEDKPSIEYFLKDPQVFLTVDQ